MKRKRAVLGKTRQGRVQTFALLALLLMGGFAIAGPSGLLAWSENLRLRDQRQAQLAELTAERDMLRNKVELLDPESADPDMVGELLRSQLNVVHPDEVMIRLRPTDYPDPAVKRGGSVTFLYANMVLAVARAASLCL